MKRILLLILAIMLILSAVVGCKKMPAVDKNVKPEAHFSHYQALTELYGTTWRDTLKKLNIDLQELDAEGLNYVGVPMQETYADIMFDVALRFGGEDNHLCGVEYTATYQYPDEEGKLLQDIVKINRALISDLGEPSDTSVVFNWAEKRMGEKWNRDIKYWQDTQVLKRLLDDGYDGRILLWNLNSVAPAHFEALEIEHGLSVSFSVHNDAGTAVITISY